MVSTIDVKASLWLTLCCLLLVMIFKFYWNRRRLYLFAWKCKGPFAWPLVGNALSWTGGTNEVTKNLQKMYLKYDSAVRFWFGPMLVYITQSPEEINIIVNSQQSLKKDVSYNLMRPMMGTGLVTAPVPIWKVHRKALNHTFNQKILDSYVSIFQEQSVVLNQKLKAYVGKGEFNLMTPINLYTLDILCESAMGIKLHGQDRESRFIYCFDRMKAIVFERMYHLWYRSHFIFNRTELAKEFYGIIDEARDFIRIVVQNKRAELQKRREDKALNKDTYDYDAESARRKSFLEYVLELTDEENKFSDEDCIDEVTTFMTAGSDASATTNSFSAMMLGMFPEIQEKVFEELEEVFGDSNRPVTVEDLPKLKYLERVLKETMRFFPPLLVVARETTDELDLKTIKVPKGVALLMVILNVHMDPKNYPDPMRFDPDRFLPEEIAKRHPCAYIPFSSGPRNCMGFQFALMSMKLTMATILRTYKFKTNYKKIEDIKIGMYVTTRPVEGHMVEIHYRDNNKQ